MSLRHIAAASDLGAGEEDLVCRVRAECRILRSSPLRRTERKGMKGTDKGDTHPAHPQTCVFCPDSSGRHSQSRQYRVCLREELPT